MTQNRVDCSVKVCVWENNLQPDVLETTNPCRILNIHNSLFAFCFSSEFLNQFLRYRLCLQHSGKCGAIYSLKRNLYHDEYVCIVVYA
jgi:hypothetical protein